MNIFVHVLCLAGAISLSSCMSFGHTFFGRTDDIIYRGTRDDIAELSGENRECCYRPPAWFAIIDLPFSFILDTLLLPYTVPYTLVHADRE